MDVEVTSVSGQKQQLLDGRTVENKGKLILIDKTSANFIFQMDKFLIVQRI